MSSDLLPRQRERHARHYGSTRLPFDLPAVKRKSMSADFPGGLISSNGGMVPLRDADGRLGPAKAPAGCIGEWREPEQLVHTLPTTLHFRMFSITRTGACPRAGEAGSAERCRRPLRATPRPFVQASGNRDAGDPNAGRAPRCPETLTAAANCKKNETLQPPTKAQKISKGDAPTAPRARVRAPEINQSTRRSAEK